MPRYTIIKLRELHRYLNNKKYSEKIRYLLEYGCNVHSIINRVLQSYGGIVFNLDTGEYIALTNGIGEDIHRELLIELDRETMHGVQMASVTASNPLTALLGASIYFSKGHRFVFEEEAGSRDEYWVASIQLPLFSSSYDAYIVYNSLYNSIHRAAEKYGGLLVEKTTGLVTIVGGKELGSLVNELSSIGFVGVGVSPIGRNAYRNAFKALQLLIDGVVDGRLHIIQG